MLKNSGSMFMNKKPDRVKNRNYTILSYGCQMNIRDSETIAGLLEAAGYQPSPRLEEAGLVVLNTCSVRHSAENKVFGKLGELKQLKNTIRKCWWPWGDAWLSFPKSGPIYASRGWMWFSALTTSTSCRY
jgi:tRNA-i(6)A37 thiotransferase enzyme MiaB